MCYLAIGILYGKKLLDMKEETHKTIDLYPKDRVYKFDYSDLTISALCGSDLELESVVVW